ncbi:MAG: 50S ribosomal protein L28 [Rivularia sp. (in: cyanobacteria)]
MSRRCQLTGKKANNGYAVSHSHRRTKKLQQANLQSKRVWWAEGNRWVRLKLSTKAIKTLEKKGLDAMAKEAGINLNRI